MTKPRIRLDSKGNIVYRSKSTLVNSSAYEGAGTGRRALTWYAPNSGPNATLSNALPNLRNRSRAGYRNNPLLASAIDSLVSNEIGCGIIPRSRHDDEAIRKAINSLWERSVNEFDPEGVLDFYGMQAQLARARRTGSEVFIRKRRRFADEQLAVPMQIQILESEFVPVEKNESLPNGNTIRHGIEFNKRGQRVAYHMYASHPGEWSGPSIIDSTRLLRIPASDVIHHYLPTRPGQVRGEPDAAQALLKAHTFDSYDDAELVRKQTKAPYTGFISKDSFTEQDYQYDPFTGEAINTFGTDDQYVNVQPGSIIAGLPGESLTMFNGDNTGDGYADFMRQQSLAIAAGVGVPFELMTGDWSKVNDRLVRAILNEFRRKIEMAQDHLMIFQVCQGVWNWWLDVAVQNGRIHLPGYAVSANEHRKVEWRPQAWPYVHPEQDINAKIKAIEANLTSSDAEVAKTGWDAEEVDRQNVEAEQRRKQLRETAGLDFVSRETI